MNELKGLVIAAKQGEVYKEQIGILQQRIGEKEVIVKALEGKDSVTVAKYNQEIALIKEELSSVKTALRKEKRRRFWTGVGGVMTTGIVTYLAIKK